MFALVVLIAGFLAKSDVKQALRFPKEVSVNNYIMLNPDFSEVGTSLSVCTWIKTFKASHKQAFWFSYAVPHRDNEILFAVHGHHWFHQVQYNWNPVFMLKNQWYHFCFTWSKGSPLDFYLNGALVNSRTGNVASIQSGGTLVIGQEQDKVGGGFDINQSFGGELIHLNVFSRKLRKEEVAAMYFDGRCSQLPSSLVPDVVLSWEEILGAQRSGAVEKVSAECAVRDDGSFFAKITELVFQELKTCD